MQAALDEIESTVDNELPPLIETEEEMISEKDKEWIQEAIKNSRTSTDDGTDSPSSMRWLFRHIPLIGTIVAICAGIGLPLYFHYTSEAATTTDEHIKLLINGQLAPAIQGANLHTDTAITILSGKVDTLSEHVAHLEGQLGDRIAALQAKSSQLESLAKLEAPARVLANIREEIEIAQRKSIPLQQAQADLVDYKNAVQALPQTAYQYWATLAAIINYQSRINQMSGSAPDPAKVSKPCIVLTASPNLHMNNVTISYEALSDCVVDLDNPGLSFDHVVFRDSVIRYSGGKTKITAARFVNCTFVLNIKSDKVPAKPSVLLAIIQSPDQKSVKVD